MSILTDLWTFITKPSADDDADKRGNYTPWLVTALWFGCVVGILALLLMVWDAPSIPTGLKRLGGALMAMLACVATGALLGLIFGIPRIDPGAVDPSGAGRIRQNDSLEQIADWLTKTIVGVSLVQAREIGGTLKELSGTLSAEVFGAAKGAIMPGMGLIVGMAALGFMLAYVWTRRYWVLDMRRIEETLGRRSSLTQAVQVLDKATQMDPKAAKEQGPQRLELVRVQAQTLSANKGPWTSTPLPAEGGDTWAGKFGGSAEDLAKGRRLRVEFKRAPEIDASGQNDWYQLRFIVEATAASKPLSGKVRFFVHATFQDPIREVPVVLGQAVLELMAWGGDFTVGAQADWGGTELELHVGRAAPDWVSNSWRQL